MVFATLPTTPENVSRSSDIVIGNKELFAIEVLPAGVKGCAHLQFHVQDIVFGDVEEIVETGAVAKWLERFCDMSNERVDRTLHSVDSERLFKLLHSDYYNSDWSKMSEADNKKRERFHLDDVGMAATADKFGIVVVSTDGETDRILVKNYASDGPVLEKQVPRGVIEKVGREFIIFSQG